jgi:hypothetical protein
MRHLGYAMVTGLLVTAMLETGVTIGGWHILTLICTVSAVSLLYVLIESK